MNFVGDTNSTPSLIGYTNVVLSKYNQIIDQHSNCTSKFVEKPWYFLKPKLKLKTR